jgi:glucans biosynthesis protein
LQKPKTKDKVITLYALLDSKSVSGAYRFEIIPGANTIMNIEAHLFPRENIQKIGIAPLTSMFLFGENNKNDFDDFRLEVHDSDGLLVHNGHGEWLWRPLDNSKKLRISSFVDNGLKGFGLLQRDRDLSNYQDFEANYQSRPSAWVEPLENWNEGIVQLVEIPSRQEIHDNIVAYWVPKVPIEAGREYKFSYRLIWLNDVIKGEDIAYVSATRTGQGGISGTEGISESRKFVIDFIGKNLGSDFSQKGITPNVSAISGKIINVSAIYNPITKGITVYADYAPHSDNDEIRISLEQNGKTISEVWSYQWLK